MDHIRLSLTDEEGMEFMVELCHEYDDLVRARFLSRHSKNKNRTITIQFDRQKQQPMEAWYCTSSASARKVGICLCQEIDQDSQEYIAWRLSFDTRVPRTS